MFSHFRLEDLNKEILKEKEKEAQEKRDKRRGKRPYKIKHLPPTQEEKKRLFISCLRSMLDCIRDIRIVNLEKLQGTVFSQPTPEEQIQFRYFPPNVNSIMFNDRLSLLYQVDLNLFTLTLLVSDILIHFYGYKFLSNDDEQQ